MRETNVALMLSDLLVLLRGLKCILAEKKSGVRGQVREERKQNEILEALDFSTFSQKSPRAHEWIPYVRARCVPRNA